ncbi:hypothetical protein QU39_00200, partial [Staphylococcus aureus]
AGEPARHGGGARPPCRCGAEEAPRRRAGQGDRCLCRLCRLPEIEARRPVRADGGGPGELSLFPRQCRHLSLFARAAGGDGPPGMGALGAVRDAGAQSQCRAARAADRPLDRRGDRAAQCRGAEGPPVPHREEPADRSGLGRPLQ